MPEYTSGEHEAYGLWAQWIAKDGVIVWAKTGYEPVDLEVELRAIRERDERYDPESDFCFSGRGD